MRKIIFVLFLVSYASTSSAEYDLCVSGPDALLDILPTTEIDVALKAAMLSKRNREDEAEPLYKKLSDMSERIKTQNQAKIWSEKQLYLAYRKCHLGY